MKLTLFGATGGTGRAVLAQALAAGHYVTAYVRSPDKLNIRHDNLTVVQGAMNEPARIAAAIAGADAVVSTLGPTENKPGRPLTAGMQHIIDAMRQAAVVRLIATTGAGVRDPNDKPRLIHRLIGFVLATTAKHVLDDSIGMVEAIRMSDRTWTILRAPRLTDGAGGKPVKVGYIGEGPGAMLARADFARVILEQLTSPRWEQKMPAVSN